MVFDASGSMWAQMEDGRSRIEIAREVIAEFDETRDSSIPLGVVAYGHNRRGDCGDIEAILSLDQHDGGVLADRLNALNPRGMTPLTDSMAMARDMIPRTAESADIILVTDGLENCDGDPCALAREIAAEGIDIRAHVVGFALSHEETATLSCVPEETGGQLFTTNSGAELSAALTQVSETPEPQELPVTIQALDARDMSVLGGAEWEVVLRDSGDEVFAGRQRGIIDLDLAPGSYTVFARTPSSEGETEFEVTADLEGPVDVALEKVLATMHLRAENAETGDTIDGADWTVMNLATEEAESFSTEAQVYPVHTEPGDYRIEAVSGDMEGGVVVTADLAEDKDVTVPIEAPVAEIPDVTLDAPGAVGIRESFDVGLSEPVAGYLLFVPADEPGDETASRYDRMRNSVTGDTQVSRTAPSDPGLYELRLHRNEDHQMVALATVEVQDIQATMQAPEEVEAGSEFAVTLGGGVSGHVVIVDPDRPDDDIVSRYDRMRNSVDGDGEITRNAPEEAGPYELRYHSSGEHRLLARQTINVVETGDAEVADAEEARAEENGVEEDSVEENGRASLTAPDEAGAGATIEVEWDGPDDRRDFIAVVEMGAPEGSSGESRRHSSRTSGDSPVSIQLPDALGDFELRYVHNESGETLASRTITLTPVTAELSAPEQVAAGSTIDVEWEGPDNRRDFVVLVEPDAPEGSSGESRRHSARTSGGSPVSLLMPDSLGTYELRYVLHQSGRTLATRPIELTGVEASLSVPEEIPAGSGFDVEWEGPDNRRDFIAIVEAGAPEDYSGSSRRHSARTSGGSPVSLLAPDALGSYEVRYVVHQSGRVLASEPVTLTPVSASLEIDGPILPGGEFDVTWEGPDNRRDFIAIVAPDAPEGSSGDSRSHNARTSGGSPVTLTAPEDEGDFEVRYVIHQSDRTLARLPVTVGSGEVSLSIEDEVTADGVVTVNWQGPGRFEDFIEIVPAGADDDAGALRDARASQGSPVQLFAPSEPDTYELRYRASDSGEILARIEFTVHP